MGRQPEPRWWAERGGYFAIVAGKRKPLAKGKENKAEAWRVLRRILAEQDAGGAARTDKLDLHSLLDLFLDRVARDLEPSTLTFYRSHLEPFAGRVGAIPCVELRPKHVDQWLAKDGKDWSDSTRRGAITAVKAATSWAAKMGYLSADPLKSVPRPRMERRKAIAPEMVPRILDTIPDQAFADLLTALIESGCRPGEAFKVTADDIDFERGVWILKGKTTRRTGKAREVVMTPKLEEVCRRLCEQNPDGPIFLNTQGRPWTRNAVRCRFRTREALLGGRIQANGFRHMFGTDALLRLTPALAAALMGHSDLKMLEEHYGHVGERSEALRRAAALVRPTEAEDT